MHPEIAQSDGQQSLKPERFAALVEKLRQLAPVVGRQVAPSPQVVEPHA